MKTSKVDLEFTWGRYAFTSRAPNPYIWSSTNWLLFEAGLLWESGGRSEPVMARKSRGYTVRVQTAANDWVLEFAGDDLTPSLRRL